MLLLVSALVLLGLSIGVDGQHDVQTNANANTNYTSPKINLHEYTIDPVEGGGLVAIAPERGLKEHDEDVTGGVRGLEYRIPYQARLLEFSVVSSGIDRKLARGGIVFPPGENYEGEKQNIFFVLFF